MNKDQERHLYLNILLRCKPYKTHVRDIINEMLDEKRIDSYKQALRTLEKWSGKDIYEYGVCLDLGWLTIDHSPTAEQVIAHDKLRENLNIDSELYCL